MKIVFHTNIDAYKTNCFPKNLAHVPRIGETVEVVKGYEGHYTNKGLPTRLEVVDVIHTEDKIICELWYKKIDVEFAKLNNKNLFP